VREQCEQDGGTGARQPHDEDRTADLLLAHLRVLIQLLQGPDLGPNQAERDLLGDGATEEVEARLSLERGGEGAQSVPKLEALGGEIGVPAQRPFHEVRLVEIEESRERAPDPVRPTDGSMRAAPRPHPGGYGFTAGAAGHAPSSNRSNEPTLGPRPPRAYLRWVGDTPLSRPSTSGFVWGLPQTPHPRAHSKEPA
jgi:hypothetical protein